MPQHITTLARVFSGACIPLMVAAAVRYPEIAARVRQLARDLSDDEAEADFWQAMTEEGEAYV